MALGAVSTWALFGLADGAIFTCTWDFVEFISTGSMAGHLQPIPQYCGPDINTLRSGFFKIRLMMAAIEAVKTFGLAINHRPCPNSPDNDDIPLVHSVGNVLLVLLAYVYVTLEYKVIPVLYCSVINYRNNKLVD